MFWNINARLGNISFTVLFSYSQNRFKTESNMPTYITSSVTVVLKIHSCLLRELLSRKSVRVDIKGLS